MIQRQRRRRIAVGRSATAWVVGIVAALMLCSGAHAADLLPGWGQWWLPPDRSTHGHAIDMLFLWIFWITMIIFILVEIVLVVFLFKYRARPDRKKGHYTHGNTRLEMAWTIAPAIILALLALFSKKVWDNYRYSPTMHDPNRARVLVIGERFKWNVIYPGPDGEFGRYLVFPKPTDLKWPDGQPFDGVNGPAELPYDKSVSAIKRYIDQKNKLGKDMNDPAGKDDDYEASLARLMEIPVNRPVEVVLSSKDVLHGFFLPNYRVKLDTVPGMRGHVMFTATMTSKQREATSLKTYKIDDLIAATRQPGNSELTAVIPENTPGADRFRPRGGQPYWRFADAEKKTIVRDGGTITTEIAEKLKAANVAEVTAKLPGYWEIVCEELCGEGHGTMKGQMLVLSQEEYDAKKWDRPSRGAPTTAPSIAMSR